MNGLMESNMEKRSGEREQQAHIGVIFAILGNMAISIALNVQKYVHNEIGKRTVTRRTPPSRTTSKPEEENLLLPENSIEHQNNIEYIENVHKTNYSITNDNNELDYLQEPRWWLGISLMFLGELGNFLAYGYAPAILVTPLGTVALICNAMLAPIFLREKFRKWDLFGIMLAIIGTVILVVVSSRTEEPVLSPNDLWFAITKISFLIYFAVTISLIFILTWLSRLIGHKYIWIDLSLVAIYGGYTVLSTKAISSLLNLTFFGMFGYPITYLFFTVLILTAMLQIRYLNTSLQRFDSVAVIPTQFVLFTCATIIGSAVLYNDFDRLDLTENISLMAGLSSMFGGVYFITRRKSISDEQITSIAADVGFQSDVLINPFESSPSRSESVVDFSSNRESLHSSRTKSLSNSLPIAVSAPRQTNLMEPSPFNYDRFGSSGHETSRHSFSSLTRPILRSGSYVDESQRGSVTSNSSSPLVRKISRVGGSVLSLVGTHEVRKLELGQIVQNYLIDHPPSSVNPSRHTLPRHYPGSIRNSRPSSSASLLHSTLSDSIIRSNPSS